MLKERRLGLKLFWLIVERVSGGFPRTFESDDPVRRVEMAKGQGRLCSVLGVGVVEQPSGAVGIGRESLLALLEGSEGLDVAAVERAFLAEWNAPRSAAFQLRLEQVRKRLVSEVKLRHSLVGMFPEFRVWRKDPEYDPNGGPVQTREVVGDAHLSGVFIKNIVDQYFG